MKTDNVPELPAPQWSLWDVGIVLLVVFCVMPLTWLIKYLAPQVLPAETLRFMAAPGMALLLGTLLQAVLMTAAVFVTTRRKGARLNDLGVRFDDWRTRFFRGLGGGVLLWIGVIMLSLLMAKIFGSPPDQTVERLLTGLKAGREWWMPFVAVCIIAPLAEEVYFRGMVYPAVKIRIGRWPAMVLSGLFFGALHLDLYRMVPISLGGIALAYFYEKTGSLVTPFTAHSTWNSLMLLAIYAAGR